MKQSYTERIQKNQPINYINKCIKVTRYKINTKKSIVFLHAGNKKLDNGISKTVLALTYRYRVQTSNYLCVCVPAKSCLTLCDLMGCSPPGSCPWNFPGKNTGVGCHFLLQGIFSPRNQTRVSCIFCIAGRFFTTEPPGMPMVTSGKRDRGRANIGAGGKDYYGVTRNQVCESFENCKVL